MQRTVVTRQRAIFGDDVLGYVIPTHEGWTGVDADGVALAETFTSAASAEAALRAAADQRTGERVIVAAALVAAATHPVLYTATHLF